MFPGACPWETSGWILHGPNMNIFASHKQMTSEPDLTYLQALDKEIDQLMSGKCCTSTSVSCQVPT